MNSDAHEKSLQYGLIEGALSSLYASLCGGVFVIGLAVLLGGGEITVGLLAAAPNFATIATFAGSYLIERGLTRKTVTRGSMHVSRFLWLPFIAAYPLLLAGRKELALTLLVVLMLVSSIVGAIAVSTWQGWMIEVVPLAQRGRYFGLRNAIVGLVTTLATWLGGRLVEWNFGLGSANPTTGYLALFGLGLASGVLATIVLGWVTGGGPEVSVAAIHRTQKERNEDKALSFSELAALPMRHPNFRRFIIFQFIWIFGVYMAAPFFAVIMLRDFSVGIKYVAMVVALQSLASVITYRGWGALTDRFGNKPIMIFCTLFSAAFPLWWFFINPHNYYWPLIAFHFLAGVSWAGYILASTNLLLRLAPQEHNSIYISIFNTLTGLAAAVGPLVGGVLGMVYKSLGVGKYFYPLLLVFLMASIIRYSSVKLLVGIEEPEESPVTEFLKELGSIRGINTLMGLDLIIQFFTAPLKKDDK